MKTVPPRKFPFGVTQCSPHSTRDLLAEVRLLLSNKTLQPRTILCLNSHIYNLACDDERLRACLNSARIVAADGMAIVWAVRLLGGGLSERCNMTEAYHAFLADPSIATTRGPGGAEMPNLNLAPREIAALAAFINGERASQAGE